MYSFFFHVDGSLPLGKPLTTGVGRRAYYPEWPGFSIKVAIGLEVLAMPSEQIRTVVAALVEEATLRLREFAEQKRPDIAHSPLTRTVALGLADFHMIDLPEGDSPQTAQIRRLVE